MGLVFNYIRLIQNNFNRFIGFLNNSLRISFLLIIHSVLSISMVLISCTENKWTDEKENFTQTYMEILIAREQIDDSLRAQNTVQTIMQNHGYNEQSFAKQFLEYSHTPDQLKLILDSAQARARREIKR